MDAIRKKMQSLKGETDSLYAIIKGFEDETKESNRRSDQADCDIRDFGKKVSICQPLAFLNMVKMFFSGPQP
jgi:hypothetical protein